jgi:hypothetical protein
MKSSLKATRGESGVPTMSEVFDRQDEALLLASPLRKFWETYDDFVRRYAPNLLKPVPPARDYQRIDAEVTFFLTTLPPLGEVLERRKAREGQNGK